MCLKTVSFSMIGKSSDCAARLSWMEEQVLQPEEGIKTIKQRGEKADKTFARGVGAKTALITL